MNTYLLTEINEINTAKTNTVKLILNHLYWNNSERLDCASVTIIQQTSSKSKSPSNSNISGIFYCVITLWVMLQN